MINFAEQPQFNDLVTHLRNLIVQQGTDEWYTFSMQIRVSADGETAWVHEVDLSPTPAAPTYPGWDISPDEREIIAPHRVSAQMKGSPYDPDAGKYDSR